MADYYAYLDEITQALLACHTPARGRRRLTEAAIRHAIAFPTWQSLVRWNGISANQAARLMRATVSAAAHRSTP